MLPQVGTKDYLALLIQHLQANLDFELDKNVFLGILLCLIAGQRNLIVDVDIDWELREGIDVADHARSGSKERERRIQSVLQHVCDMCQAICSRIFNMTSNTIGVASRWTAASLPTALFPLLPAPDRPISPSNMVEAETRRLRPSKDVIGSSKNRRHEEDIIESNTTKPILSPPKKQSDGPSEPSHQAHTQLTDEDVYDGTASSETSHATTRSALYMLGDEAGLEIPQALIVTGIEDARPGVHLKLLEMLEDRKVKWEEQDEQAEKESMEGNPIKPAVRLRSQPLPEGFILIYVRPSLVSRRIRRQERTRQSVKKARVKRLEDGSEPGKGDFDDIPSWLTDKFALNCVAARGITGEIVAERVARARGRTDNYEALIDIKLLRTLRRLSEKTHMHPPLRFRISDLISTTIHHPQLYSVFGSTSISDFKTFVRISRILFRSFSWRPELLDLDVKGREYDQRRKLQEAMEREEWYATEQDVKRVWRNLIRHRVEWRPVRQRILYTTVGSACSYRPLDRPQSSSSLFKRDERVDEILDDILVVLG